MAKKPTKTPSNPQKAQTVPPVTGKQNTPSNDTSSYGDIFKNLDEPTGVSSPGEIADASASVQRKRPIKAELKDAAKSTTKTDLPTQSDINRIGATLKKASDSGSNDVAVQRIKDAVKSEIANISKITKKQNDAIVKIDQRHKKDYLEIQKSFSAMNKQINRLQDNINKVSDTLRSTQREISKIKSKPVPFGNQGPGNSPSDNENENMPLWKKAWYGSDAYMLYKGGRWAGSNILRGARAAAPILAHPGVLGAAVIGGALKYQDDIENYISDKVGNRAQLDEQRELERQTREQNKSRKQQYRDNLRNQSHEDLKRAQDQEKYKEEQRKQQQMMKLGGPKTPIDLSKIPQARASFWPFKKRSAATTAKNSPSSFAGGQYTFEDLYHRAKIDDQNSQFMKFGQLPPGFEFIHGHMGRLGSPGAVSARGAMPLMGGGFNPGTSYNPGSSYTPAPNYGSTTGTPNSGPVTVIATPQTGTQPSYSTPPSATPGVPFSGNQKQAYVEMYKAAVKAGSPNPQLTAAIAMHESGYLTSGISKGFNPFGQTVTMNQVKQGTGGVSGFIMGKDGQPHAKYPNYETAVADHLRRWGSHYSTDDKQALANLVSKGYNTADPGWTAKILSIASKNKLPQAEIERLNKDLQTTAPPGQTPSQAPQQPQKPATPGQAPAGFPSNWEMPQTGDVSKIQYNRFSGKGTQPGDVTGQLVDITTPFGGAKVHRSSAAAYSGFFDDLSAAGAPIKTLGSYNVRQKRAWLGGSGWSEHSFGNAIDIDNTVGWSPALQKWFADNPGKFEELKSKWGMKQGIKGDPNHVEYGGVMSEGGYNQLMAKYGGQQLPTQQQVPGQPQVPGMPAPSGTGFGGLAPWDRGTFAPQQSRPQAQSAPTGFNPRNVSRDMNMARPQAYDGVLKLGDANYRFRSGSKNDRNYPSVPYGAHGLIPHQGSSYPDAIKVTGVGANVDTGLKDPKTEGRVVNGRRQDDRTDVLIHPASGADLSYTLGCMAIPKKDWPNLLSKVKEMWKQHGEQNVVLVNGPNGAEILSKQEYETKYPDGVVQSPAQVQQQAQQPGNIVVTGQGMEQATMAFSKSQLGENVKFFSMYDSQAVIDALKINPNQQITLFSGGAGMVEKVAQYMKDNNIPLTGLRVVQHHDSNDNRVRNAVKMGMPIQNVFAGKDPANGGNLLAEGATLSSKGTDHVTSLKDAFNASKGAKGISPQLPQQQQRPGGDLPAELQPWKADPVMGGFTQPAQTNPVGVPSVPKSNQYLPPDLQPRAGIYPTQAPPGLRPNDVPGNDGTLKNDFDPKRWVQKDKTIGIEGPPGTAAQLDQVQKELEQQPQPQATPNEMPPANPAPEPGSAEPNSFAPTVPPDLQTPDQGTPGTEGTPDQKPGNPGAPPGNSGTPNFRNNPESAPESPGSGGQGSYGRCFV